MSRRAAPRTTELTPAQRALFESAPGLAEEAAHVAVRGAGEARFRHLSWEEMVSIATIAAMEATTTFDPAGGESYRTWAFFSAVCKVIDAGREESRRYAKVKAAIRANAMVYFGRVAAGEVEIGVDTEASLTDKLYAVTNPVIGLALLEAAVSRQVAGEEDEVAEVDAAARAGEALRQALPAEGTDERRMLELHFVQRKPLAEVARDMGVDARGYRTFLRRFDQVLAGIRDGLLRRGIAEMPPWREDVSGRPLGLRDEPP
jgi:RNA polymerase sigma factor (sigma-70 family)